MQPIKAAFLDRGKSCGVQAFKSQDSDARPDSRAIKWFTPHSSRLWCPSRYKYTHNHYTETGNIDE